MQLLECRMGPVYRRRTMPGIARRFSLPDQSPGLVAAHL